MAPRISAKVAGLAAARGRSRPLFDVPGIVDYGGWRTFIWDNQGNPQHGAALVPVVPPWRRLFAALDDIGAALPDSPPTVLDEADAIVACCWRYGSYFHVLTGGEFYPPFRTDPSLSRIGDAEMRRINIEFSAALSTWLATKAEDPGRNARRVFAALTTLRMPWRERRQPWWGDAQKCAAREHAEALQRLLEKSEKHHDVWQARVLGRDVGPATIRRVEANWAVLWCYRNGPIEDLHAGRWSFGREVPGFLRFYAREVERLERHISERVADYLFQRTVLSPDALRIASAIGAPRNWTLTGETFHVPFLGMPGLGSLEPRLRHLADRYPRHFGGVITAARYDLEHDRILE